MPCNSSLSRKRNTISLQYTHKLIWALLIAVFSASCASKKPRVITTKAEAREYRASPTAATIETNSFVPEQPEEESIEVEMVNSDEVVEPLLAIDAAIAHARAYEGVRYRYGGSSRTGMDCSGLVHLAFDHIGQQVPRNSRSLFDASTPIDLEQVDKGDLMFFATGRDRKKINHVALVIEVTPAEIRFIHATVSSGVIVSSFNEPYWLGKYLSAGRLL